MNTHIYIDPRRIMGYEIKTRFFIFIIIGFASTNLAFSQGADPRPVFQSWNEVNIILPLVRSKDSKGKVFNRVTATFSVILRVGRSDVDAVDRRVGVVLDFRVNKYLTLLTGVLYRKDELVKNTPRSETRFVYGATLSKTWHDFSFRDRNMFEHRVRNGRVDLDIYRQRIHIGHPLKCKDKVLFTPFISEEGYLDLGNKKWVQNEFFAGVSRIINSRTSVDIAYVRNDSKPANVNGLALNLKISLR